MDQNRGTFGDKLAGMEIPTTALREEYERQVQTMIEQKLTGASKLAHVGGLTLGLCFVVIFGTTAVLAPAELPPWGRAIFILGAVFGLGIVAFEAWLLKKGAVNLKTDEVAMAGIGWGFIVIVTTIILVFSGKLPDRTVSIKMLVSALIFEVAAGFMLNKALMKRSELTVREKLLEIECRLTKLAADMAAAQKQRPEERTTE